MTTMTFIEGISKSYDKYVWYTFVGLYALCNLIRFLLLCNWSNFRTCKTSLN